MHVELIVSQMTPFRPVLMSLLPPHLWGDIETILALSVVVLSFVQKAHDHSNSGYTIFGLFSYFALVIKAGFCLAVALDGLYAAANGESPRPIATCLLGVLVLQQARTLVFQMLLRRTVQGVPPAAPFYETQSIIRMPVK